MTRKEQMPKDNSEDRERSSKDQDLDYNPDITSEDKSVLNNQSQDERIDGYYNERKEPIDHAGEDLDLPEMDDKQFNQTKNKADDSTVEKRPKQSANNSDDARENTETVYKGEKAEKYTNDNQEENPDEDRHLRGND